MKKSMEKHEKVVLLVLLWYLQIWPPVGRSPLCAGIAHYPTKCTHWTDPPLPPTTSPFKGACELLYAKFMRNSTIIVFF